MNECPSATHIMTQIYIFKYVYIHRRMQDLGRGDAGIIIFCIALYALNGESRDLFRGYRGIFEKMVHFKVYFNKSSR